MRVYHLSNQCHALSNIRNNRIKISTIDKLNDPFELLGMNLSDKEFRKSFTQKRQDIIKKIGVLCFSKSWANPVLWSHYGDKHYGLCLGFDIPDSQLIKVNYFKSLSEMKDEIDPRHIHFCVIQDLLARKFQDWAYEQEYRLMINLESAIFDKDLYFQPFSNELVLREVIIGPRAKITQKQIAQVLKDKYCEVVVKKARIAFKTYHVVRNKRYKNLVI